MSMTCATFVSSFGAPALGMKCGLCLPLQMTSTRGSGPSTHCPSQQSANSKQPMRHSTTSIPHSANPHQISASSASSATPLPALQPSQLGPKSSPVESSPTGHRFVFAALAIAATTTTATITTCPARHLLASDLASELGWSAPNNVLCSKMSLCTCTRTVLILPPLSDQFKRVPQLCSGGRGVKDMKTECERSRSTRITTFLVVVVAEQ